MLANHLAKRLKEDDVNVNYLIVVDAANGPDSHKVDRTFSDNVEVVDNYYTSDRSNALGSYGDEGKAENEKTQVNNKVRVTYKNGDGNKQKVTHSNVDEATFKERSLVPASIVPSISIKIQKR